MSSHAPANETPEERTSRIRQLRVTGLLTDVVGQAVGDPDVGTYPRALREGTERIEAVYQEEISALRAHLEAAEARVRALEAPWAALERSERDPSTEERSRVVFGPHWPDSLDAQEVYQRPCDDERESHVQVFISEDGDTWLSVYDHSRQSLAGVRIRTRIGGGRAEHTRQALLWLAEAIRRDNGGGTSAR